MRAGIFMATFATALLLGACSESGNSSAAASVTPEPTAAPVVVTAAKLAKDYDENTVAADAKYKEKQLQVTGKIVDISTDFAGSPYLTLRGNNEFMGPQFGFSADDAPALAKLKKGQQVTLLCTGRGDVVKTPMSDDCSVQP